MTGTTQAAVPSTDKVSSPADDPTVNAEGGHLPLRLCIGWGVGTFGISVMFNSVNLLLQRFATDYLGIAAGSFALIYFLSKVYDAVTDPLMGHISDRTHSRFGRRRPYLVLGGVLCAVAFAALFNAPSAENVANPALYLGLLLILYSTAYTVFNVPYLAMPAEMTTRYAERTKLVSFRVYAIGFGSLVGLSAAPALVKLFGGGREGHQILALIFGGVILLASLLSFWGTRGARATQRVTAHNLSIGKQWRLVFSNRPFMTLVGVKVLHLASLAVTLGAYVYFVVYVLEKGYGVVALLGVANALGMLVGNPIWALIMRKVGDKRVLYMAASVFGAVVLLTWGLATAAEPLAITLLRKFLHGIATAGSLLFGQSMLPDAIAHDAARSGLRREGIFAGVYTTAEKFAFAIGGALTAAFLGAMGYVSSTQGGAVQPDSAILAIYLSLSVLPAALLLISVLLLGWYDLTEEQVRKDAQTADKNSATGTSSAEGPPQSYPVPPQPERD